MLKTLVMWLEEAQTFIEHIYIYIYINTKNSKCLMHFVDLQLVVIITNPLGR